MPKQLQNNSEKVEKMGFLALKMVQMTLHEGQNLNENMYFISYLSTYLAKDASKNSSFKATNDAWIITNQPQNRFEKVHKMSFSTL